MAFDSVLEASPQTPMEGPEARAWRLFSSVIRGTWSEIIGEDQVVQVVPNEMEGNTNTKSY